MSANNPYRYTSSRKEEDEKRPEPVGWLSGVVADAMKNAGNIPGVTGTADFIGGIMSGAQQFAANVPKENALLGALDVVSRPNYAIASAADELVKGKGLGGAMEGLGSGFTGKTKTTFSDVLDSAGVDEGPHLKLGPLDVSARDAAGFVADVALDPTTYLTFGAGAAAKAGAKGAGKLGATAIKTPGMKQAAMIAPFDPFTAVARAADRATSLVPPLQGARDAIRANVGQIFESNYTLKGAGYGDVADEMARLRRAPNVLKQEAIDDITRRFAPLDDQQREVFFKAADTGFDLADQEAEMAIARARAVNAYAPTEPWQMTLDEYRASMKGKPLPRMLDMGGSLNREGKIQESHRQAVADAMQSGKPVPKEAIGPYPSLHNAKYPTTFENALPRAEMVKVPDLAPTTGDASVDTLLRWYRGDYQPAMQAIKETMGLDSFLDNYIRHVFPEKLPGGGKVGTGSPMSKRNPGSFKQRKGAEGFSTDPVLALVYDRAETLVRKETNDFIENTIAMYGKRLKGKDAAPEGFSEYFPKGRNAFFRTEAVPSRIEREIADSGSATIGADDLKQVLAVGKAPRYALPNEIADALNKMTSPREQIGFFRALDAVQGIWKASVTSIWPAFHMRNAMGNVFNNWQAGVSDPRVYREAYEVQRLAGKAVPTIGTPTGEAARWAISKAGKLVPSSAPEAIPLTDFLHEAKMNGAMNAGYYGEEIPSLLSRGGAPVSAAENLMQWATGPGKAAAKAAGALGADRARQAALEKINLAFAGRLAGNGIEDNARLAHILGRMGQGDSFADAMTSAKKHLFDYGDLSDTEKKLFRNVAPFYTWTRKNIPLQLEKLATNPGKAAAVAKAANMLQSDEGLAPEEKALMGNYVLERFGLVVGRDEEGNPKIINGVGLPIEDIGNLWKLTPQRTAEQWIGMAGPMLKMPLELVSNRSFFTGRSIDDESYQNMYRSAYPFVAQVPGLKDWLGITEEKVTTKDGERTYYNADPWKMWLLTNVMGRFYYTVGKATDPRKSWEDKSLNLLTGAKVTSSDVNRAAASALRGQYGFAQQRVTDERNDTLERAAANALRQTNPTSRQLAMTDYRKIRSEAMAASRAKMDVLQVESERKQADGQALKVAALKALRDPVDRALNEYYAITPEATLDEFGNPDMKAFFNTRDAFLERLEPSVRSAVRAKQLAYIDKLPPNAAKMEREYQASLESYRQYTKLPPFAVKVGEADLERMRDLNVRYMAQADTMARTKYMMGLAPGDRMLLQRYFQVRTNPSRERQQFERSHPELQRWGFVN